MSDALRVDEGQKDVGRLLTIRRLYFYLVGGIALIIFLNSASQLITLIVDNWLGRDVINSLSTGFLRESLARQGGFLIVSAPVFLLHWRLIRRRAVEVGEIRSSLRKLFFYIIIGFLLLLIVSGAFELIGWSVSLLLGAPLNESWLWPSRWVSLPINLVFFSSMLLYFRASLLQDSDWGREVGRAGTVRRLFYLIVGLIGLIMGLTGIAGLFEQGLRFLFERSAPPLLTLSGGALGMPLGDQVASGLIGILLWRVSWLNWQRVVDQHEAEGRTSLRRFYLYLATVISAVAALVPAALLLRILILRLLGVELDQGLPALALPLSYLPLGLLFWRWYWRQISRDFERYGDSSESATVRRLYFYAVAATGLVLLWLGLVDLIRALLDLLVFERGQMNEFSARQIATGLSLLSVGGPVWWIHWRSVQAIATQTNSVGRAERHSGPRRAYLYGVALAGALLILFELARFLYRVLLLALGEPGLELMNGESLDALVRSLVALVFWTVHLLAIRSDGEGTEPDVEAEEERRARRRQNLERRIRTLEGELEIARQELAAIEEVEVATPSARDSHRRAD